MNAMWDRRHRRRRFVRLGSLSPTSPKVGATASISAALLLRCPECGRRPKVRLVEPCSGASDSHLGSETCPR